MQLILTQNRILKCDSFKIGYCKENNSECLEITIEDETLHSKTAFLEFQVNEGATYTTEGLEIVEGVISYKVPNGLLSEKGFLYLQVVLRDAENNVIKSNVKQFVIDRSICAGDDLALQYPDLISELNKKLEEIEQQSISVVLAQDE